MIVGGLALAALGAIGMLGFDDAPERRMARVKLELAAADVENLARKGFEVTAVDPDGAWADVVYGQNASDASSLSEADLDDSGFEVVSDVALDGSYGPDRGYKTPDEVEALLRDYAARHPQLLTLKSIGRSSEGRDIWAARITADGYAGIVTKPTILFNAMHHAREVMSTEVALDTIEVLLAGFNQDPAVTRWVSSNVIWIVPMINVDGNNRVWTSDSMWRKNTNGGYGVDVNRNYPYRWGSCNGSSGSRSNETYRGPSAASEVETRAMMRFVGEIRPVISVSYHSYGEIVIYPYGCDGERTPKSDVVELIGTDLARRIPTDDGRGTYRPGTSWQLLYSVDGGDIDWMYHEHHVLPYVIELNSGFANGGFQPPFEQRDQTVRRLRPAWQFLLDRLDGPGVRGRVTDSSGVALPGSRITVQSTSDTTLAPQTYDVGSDGGYHIVLRPGTYKLNATRGGASVDRTVTVSESRRDLSLVL